MELYFLSLDDLDRPMYRVSKRELFNFYPFFNDYYVTIYLKNVGWTPKSTGFTHYKPFILNDRDLLVAYGANMLPRLIGRVVVNREILRSKVYKIIYRILVLHNGWWCLYLEKRHRWQCFESKGVTVVISPSKVAVLDFLNKFIVPALFKKKRFDPTKPRREIKLIENIEK